MKKYMSKNSIVAVSKQAERFASNMPRFFQHNFTVYFKSSAVVGEKSPVELW